MHDHRRLGRELDLFDTDPLMGAGLPYWLPDGAIVRHELEEYVRELERAAGYRHVYSPVLGKRELYEISGHWSHYSDDMFPPMKLGAEEVVLRPSLCPHHALIYRSRSHSYRELPLRMAELGAMYRSELSGVLGGLTRVRAIQLNDAHIFCTLDQAVDEAREALALITRAYADLGIRASRHRLSLPGEGGKYVADPALWRRATALLREVLDDSGIAYESAEGEAAFYGPKIDVQITDAAGREATLSTVQIDFHQPERFDLHYIGADGENTGRSWCTAASSGAWNGRWRTSWRNTAGRSRPGSPPCSWPSCQCRRRRRARPTSCSAGPNSAGYGRSWPPPATAASAPGSAPPASPRTRRWSANGRPPTAWSPYDCGTGGGSGRWRPRSCCTTSAPGSRRAAPRCGRMRKVTLELP